MKYKKHKHHIVKINQKRKLRDVNEIYSNVSSNTVTHHQFYFVSNHGQNKRKIQIRMNHIFCVITMNINSYLRRNGFCMTYEYMGRSTQISNVIINPFLHGRHFKMERYHRLLHGIKTKLIIVFPDICRSTSKIFWKILNMSSFTIYKFKVLIGS